MKTRLTTNQHLYTLLLILSSHSIFTMFAREELPKDPGIHKQKEAPDFRKTPILESDQKNTENKPALRFQFSYTKPTKPRRFSKPSETDPNQPVRLISRQEMEKRAIQSAFIIEIGTAAGASILTGPAAPIVIGVISLGWLIKIRSNRKKEKAKQEAEKESEKNKGSGGNGGTPDPDKDPKKDKNSPKKHPNGVYQGNSKHNPNSKGNVSKPPQDGQKALDESITVPGEKYRVGIQDGKIVKFQEHSPGEYHGYIVEEFHELDMESQKALYKADLVRSIKSGKIKQ